jgi:hypothetical protein
MAPLAAVPHQRQGTPLAGLDASWRMSRLTVLSLMPHGQFRSWNWPFFI